MIKNRY